MVIMDSNLLTVLGAYNPWLNKPGTQARQLKASLPKPFIQRQRQFSIRPGRAELVIGPRQAGKSTWIRQALSQSSESVLLLHAEELQIQELARSPALALDALKDILRPETILFFEEIQHLEDAPLFLKGLVDLDRQRKIVATGSSSLVFQGRTRESLAGRARRTLLLPFSLAEVTTTLDSALVPAIREQKIAEFWDRLVVFGGYPESWFEAEPQETLRYLVEAFVLKDASDLHQIDRPSVFRKLLELAAADIGNLVNISAWSSLAQASRSMAMRYLAIAEEAHILRMVAPFAEGKRLEVTGTPKVFFIDNGLRNAVFGGFAPSTNRADRGALWENAVYSELLKRLRLLDEIRFWRSKGGAEVDFIIRRGGTLVAVEVKAGALPRPKLARSARSFIEAYCPACFAVINADLRHDMEVDGTPIHFLTPADLDRALAYLPD